MEVYMRLKSREIVFDRLGSHIHNDSPKFMKYLANALLQIESNGRDSIEQEIQFDHVIGKTICVEAKSGDEIIFAQRKGRVGFSRFVKNREAEDCYSLFVVLKKAEEDPGCYVITTAFIGHLSFPEPWDENAFSKRENSAKARQDSIEYWSTHALVWESEEIKIIPGTETTQCPW